MNSAIHPPLCLVKGEAQRENGGTMPSSRMFPIFCALPDPSALRERSRLSVGSLHRSFHRSPISNAAVPILSDVDGLTDRQAGRQAGERGRRLHPSAHVDADGTAAFSSEELEIQYDSVNSALKLPLEGRDIGSVCIISS